MSVKYTAGQLIKMGKFKEAIPMFNIELDLALSHTAISRREIFEMMGRFANILLNPSDFDEVQSLGNAMLQIAIRIPGYLEYVTPEEFYANVKLNYETTPIND